MEVGRRVSSGKPRQKVWKPKVKTGCVTCRYEITKPLRCRPAQRILAHSATGPAGSSVMKGSRRVRGACRQAENVAATTSRTTRGQSSGPPGRGTHGSTHGHHWRWQPAMRCLRMSGTV